MKHSLFSVLTGAMLSAVIATFAGGAAFADQIDINVIFEPTNKKTGEPYDQSALDDEGGAPDLFMCVSGQQTSEFCRPSNVTNPNAAVVAARLACNNSLTCVFKDVPVAATRSFKFRLLDADLTRNEVVAEGECKAGGGWWLCEDTHGNARVEVISQVATPGKNVQEARRLAVLAAFARFINTEYLLSNQNGDLFARCRNKPAGLRAYLRESGQFSELLKLETALKDVADVMAPLSQAAGYSYEDPTKTTTLLEFIARSRANANQLNEAIAQMEQRGLGPFDQHGVGEIRISPSDARKAFNSGC